MLSRIVDICVDPYDELKKRSPGTTHRHYAPAIPLKLWSGPDEDVFIMTGEDKWCYIGMRQPPEGAFTARLFPSMEKYAKGLFSAMREMETSGSDMIIADLPDDEDLGSAVRNRLLRAAETK
jgi:L-threonylcarbamoyladenylate synthase